MFMFGTDQFDLFQEIEGQLHPFNSESSFIKAKAMRTKEIQLTVLYSNIQVEQPVEDRSVATAFLGKFRELKARAKDSLLARRQRSSSANFMYADR